MRILMNVNDQLSLSMLENHFQASNLPATVTAAPSDMMIEILRACKINLVAYYVEELENSKLINFFNEIKAIDSSIRCILFLKKENMNMISEALENIFDECFAIPVDSNDLMIRLRRMMRKPIQGNNQPETAPEPVSQNIQPPVPAVEQPLHQDYTQPEVAREQPVYTQPELSQPPDNAAEPSEEVIDTAPVSTENSYSPDNHSPVDPAQKSASSTQENPQYQVFSNGQWQGLNEESQNNEGFKITPPIEQNYKLKDKKKQKMREDKAGKKKSTAGKIFGIISKVLFGLLVFIIAVLAIFLVKSKISGGTPSVAGYEFYGVLSGSMNGTQQTSFNTGSVIFVKFKDPKKIVVGDIITFRGLMADSPMTTHRVVKVNSSGNLSFTTRGDANNVDDPNPVLASRVVGTVRWHLPYLGYLTGFAETKTGLVFLVFIPGAFVIVYETINIFRTINAESKKTGLKKKRTN